MCTRWRNRYARNTCATRNKTLRQLLRHLAAQGFTDSTRAVGRCSSRPRIVVATAAEISTLLAAAPIHVRLLILLCSRLALRFSEAYELRPTDHNAEQHTIHVIAKGDRSRILPVPPEIEKLIEAARSTNEHGRCIETLRGKSLGKRPLRQHFHNLVRRTGCNPKLIPHDLRRTTATRLYNLTKDFRAAQQLLGHSNLVSTLHYIAPLVKEDLEPLLQALHHPRKDKETVQ